MIFEIFKKFKKEFQLSKFGFYFFQSGIVLLSSAFSISIIFFIISIFWGFYIYLRDRKFELLDLPIIICFFLMPLICFAQNLSPYLKSFEINPNLTWIGLLNWLPFFICFLSFKHYLRTSKQREITAKFLIIGTFPVLVSGFSQYLFEWYGPIEAFNGLIIWFQKPLENEGLTGLFSNQNYAGAWFNVVFPFCIASFINYKGNKLKKNISLIFSIAISISIMLTFSRNAWGGLIFSLPFLLGPTSLIWIMPCLLFTFLIIYLASSDLGNISLQSIARLIVPKDIWSEFNYDFSGRETRLSIWSAALIQLKSYPLIGFGAGSFSLIYMKLNGAYAGHAHNLPLEFATSFGLPISLFLFSFIAIIIFVSFKKLLENNAFKKNATKTSLFERAWWTSFLIIFISNLFDVVIYDGRLGLIFWILFTGLTQSIKSEEDCEINF